MLSKDPWVRTLVILCVILAGFAVLYVVWSIASAFSDIVLLFFLAWVLAFIMGPTAAPLVTRARLPRPAAIALAYLGLLVLIVLGILFVSPMLITQTVQLATHLPTLAEEMNKDLVALQSELAARGIRVDLETALGPDDLARRAETIVPLILANLLGVATSVANVMFQSMLMVVISFYFALDGQRFAELFVAALPDRFRDDGDHLVESINKAFSGFLRGNVIMAIVYALGTAVILAVAGLPYVLLGSLVAGVFAIIPFVGALMAIAVPAILVLLAQSEAWIIVLVASVVLQQVVYNFVGPRVMSQTVGLHPLLILLVLLVGTRIAGVWGAVFSVPVAAAFTAMLEFYRLSFATRRRTATEAPDPSSVTVFETHSLAPEANEPSTSRR